MKKAGHMKLCVDPATRHAVPPKYRGGILFHAYFIPLFTDLENVYLGLIDKDEKRAIGKGKKNTAVRRILNPH